MGQLFRGRESLRFSFVLFILFHPILLQAIVIPSKPDIFRVWGAQSSFPKLPTEFRLMTWNVQKGTQKEAWYADMVTMDRHVDVTLLQEAMDGGSVGQYFDSLTNKTSIMAKSFIFDFGENEGQATGVATLSTFSIQNFFAIRSQSREPILSSPKMILFTQFQFDSGEPIWIVNIHAINFVGQIAYESQIKQLKEFLEKYHGKLIVAGDFNTWNPARMKFLKEFLESYQIQHVPVNEDPRLLPLDHIFTRGCRARDAQVIPDFTSSDHWPEVTKFNCKTEFLAKKGN